MKGIRLMRIGLWLLLITVTLTMTTQAQQIRSSTHAKQVLTWLETSTDKYSKSIDAALDRSRLNDTSLEDQINALVDEFEFATDRLKERAEDDVVVAADVREVLRRGQRLDMFMKTHTLNPTAQRDWMQVRSYLDQLARYYTVSWVWVPHDNTPLNRASTRYVIERLEQTSNEFQRSFDEALDRSRLDGSRYEDFMNNVVAQFELSLDKLKDQARGSGNLNPEDLKTALHNAASIDDFLKQHQLSVRTRRDWARVKANLDDLAFLNQMVWDWREKRVAPTMATGSVPPVAEGQRIGLLRVMPRSASAVAREVRHELLSDLPYYSVFDWIEFEVLPDNTVVLRGEVISPPDKKSRAEAVVEDIEGVKQVVNEIRVLPVSPNDDRLRRQLYRAIYGFNSPLFRYGIGSRQAIHIIVDRGRATLKGMVDTEGDKTQAYIRARGVPGLFEVKNDLVVGSMEQIPS